MRNASTQLYKLQQYLPFTVLKLQYKAQLSALISPSSCNSTYRLRYWNYIISIDNVSVIFQELQQYLPFTVLKLNDIGRYTRSKCSRCNSTYRLRYWNLKPLNFADLPSVSSLQQYLPFTVLKLQCNWCYWRIWCCIVATVLTVYGIETDNAA